MLRCCTRIILGTEIVHFQQVLQGSVLMLVSYVAGEGVELIVHKESVVVEEIKEVELRSRRAQFIYYRNYGRIGLQPRGHAPGRLPVKKLRHLLQKYHFLLFLCIHNKSTTTTPKCTFP